MRVLITGASGFLGGLLARTLLARGSLSGRTLDRLVVADREPPAAELSADARVEARVGDLLDDARALTAEGFDVAFHLASAVSAECEADLELGLRSNLDATRALLDALRARGGRPRVVFASSAAVFGGDPPHAPLPDVVRDDTWPTPQTSYGTQKLMLEQLLSDYSRKGCLDGRAVRLLTVSVRPGRPNGAASGFLSGMIREPLAGRPSRCPVSFDTPVALCSPGRAVEALLAASEASREAFGGRSALNLPALALRVGQMLEALEAVAGSSVRELVALDPDPEIERIVQTWPARFEARRARALGLEPDESFEAVIRRYAADHPDAVRVPLQPLR